MGPFNFGSAIFIVSLAFIILFISTISLSSMQVNIIHGLPDQQKQLMSVSKPIGVKIIDPIKGQQVPVGKNITVSGISKYNASSNCQVFVIVDSIRPYQKSLPMGQSGAADYSKWSYTLASTYAGTIIQGVNKITAKLLCQSNPNTETKFYSINVTGVNETILNQQHFVANSNNATAPFFLPISSFSIVPPRNNGSIISNADISVPSIIPLSSDNNSLITPSPTNSYLHANDNNHHHSSSSSTSSSGGSGNHSTNNDHHSDGTNNRDNNHHRMNSSEGENLFHKIIAAIKGF